MGMILVTGGAGYIGATTIRFLIGQGVDAARLVVVDDLSRGHVQALPPGVCLYPVDLTDAAALAQVFDAHDIDAVMHFAGLAYVGESMADPGLYYHVNVTGGLTLLRAMVKAGCRRLVVSSSCAVYGNPDQLPITEDSPARPINPYGHSKLAFEEMVRWFGACHGLRHVILRYFNAAGAAFGTGSRHDPETRVIPLALQAVLPGGKPFRVFGQTFSTPDGTCLRDYVHVADLAQAHHLALRHLLDGKADLTVNLGCGVPISVMDVVAAVQRITGQALSYGVASARQGDPPILVADGGLARKSLGWQPQNGLDQMVESAWVWLQRKENMT